MKRGRLNLAWARAFVDGLARAGVREACIAPGSRSTPLVLALAGEERIRTRVHLDERSAAFFALGAGKATGRPAAVVTTSGTAAANLFPAAVEAGESGAPLLLLTADRPHRLRGTDANQTVDQVKMYGGHVRGFHDVSPPEDRTEAFRYLRALAGRAVAEARGRPAGAVHLNFPFDKPLHPAGGEGAPSGTVSAGADGGVPRMPAEARAGPGEEVAQRLSGRIAGAGRGLLVAGPASRPERLGPAALRLARATGWPLLADPLSGARFGEGAGERTLGAYDLFLRSRELAGALAPELVLRLGGSPTSRVLHEYLERHRDREQVAIHDLPAWPDHRGTAATVLRADPARAAEDLAGRLSGTGAAGESAWTARWRDAERRVREAVDARRDDAWFEGEILRTVAAEAQDGDLLFAGSSMPVRELDAFGVPRDADVRVVGNRGASGIDGSVSTALGAAAASGRPGVAVLGDVALHHDMNGLLAAGREGVDIVYVVLHNDGGGIFHFLPARDLEPAFTEYFATPHGLDFRHAAEMYGLEFREVGPGGDGSPDGAGAPGAGASVAAALREARETGGAWLLQVRSERQENRRRRNEMIRAAVRAASEA